MRRRFLAVAFVLAGCRIDIPTFTSDDDGVGDAGADAPPNTMVGTSVIDYVSLAGTESAAEDLSNYIIEVYVPDDSPGGFRVATGIGTSDGTFASDNIPGAGPVYLKVLAPGSTTPTFYVTERRSVDLGRVSLGRRAPETGSTASALQIDLDAATAWAAGDTIDLVSFNAGVRSLHIETRIGNNQSPGATSLSVLSKWDRAVALAGGLPPLIQSSEGDDLYIDHSQYQSLPDNFGRATDTHHVVDQYLSTTVEMTSGQTSAVAGAMSQLTLNHTVRFSALPSTLNAGFAARTSAPGFSIELHANPYADYSSTSGFALAAVDFHDWSRASPTLAARVDVAYGDPYPAAWKRNVVMTYLRNTDLKVPGASYWWGEPTVAVRVMELAEPLPNSIDVQPPTGLEIAGSPGFEGGRIDFDQVAPIHVAWNAVASASYYEVSVLSVESGVAGTTTRATAIVKTTDTAVDVPAEVFTGSPWWAFSVRAVRQGALYSGGRLRASIEAPLSYANTVSALFRLSSTCGNSSPDSDEDCDPGAQSSPTCDIDCSLAECGDGYANAAALEECDTIEDSFGCDDDCTLVVCGDGHVNLNVEDCDDGNPDDDNNGCSGTCKRNNTCGDSQVEDQFEACDEGSDTPTCDGDCSAVECGDGYLNAAVEQCDDGNTDPGDGCSGSCQTE